MDTLYKTDSKGKIRVWSVHVKNHGMHSDIIVTHGEEHGQKQVKVTPIVEGKNVGKANETSHYQQALNEAKSKYNKQIDKGYSTNPNSFVFRPMLAHRFDKHPHKAQFPVYSQMKLDGRRACIYYDNGWKMQSRNGKDDTLMGHILKQVEDLDIPKDWVLDGELYKHGWSFQRLISAVKRDEPNEDTKDVEFHFYDLYLPKEPKVTFEDRFSKLCKHIMFHEADSPHLIQVPCDEVHDEVDVWKYFDEYVTNGLEGGILRNKKGTYKVNGRSYDLLKVKEFIDDEFEIIGYNVDKDGGIVFTCVTKDSQEFNVRPEGSLEQKQEYIADFDNIKGEMLTVRFFEWTDDGKPRFPVGVCVRNYD